MRKTPEFVRIATVLFWDVSAGCRGQHGKLRAFRWSSNYLTLTVMTESGLGAAADTAQAPKFMMTRGGMMRYGRLLCSVQSRFIQRPAGLVVLR
jgi:hypothetical protein